MPIKLPLNTLKVREFVRSSTNSYMRNTKKTSYETTQTVHYVIKNRGNLFISLGLFLELHLSGMDSNVRLTFLRITREHHTRDLIVALGLMPPRATSKFIFLPQTTNRFRTK